jgi:ABC-type phosphate transport system substrate-binding protein
MCLDRSIPEAQAALYGDLAQFPIAGQALVLAYNISTLSTSDAALVRTILLSQHPTFAPVA